MCHMVNSSWINDPTAWKGHTWDTKSMRERKLTWMCERANTPRFLQWTQKIFQFFNVLLIQFSKFHVVVLWLFLSRINSINYIRLASLLSPFKTTSMVDTLWFTMKFPACLIHVPRFFTICAPNIVLILRKIRSTTVITATLSQV